MARSKLCAQCSPQWQAWLDYRLPRPPIQLITIGNNSPQQMRDRQEARFREWRDTIRFQQQLIERICANNHARPDA